jgi:hypothetical protein
MVLIAQVAVVARCSMVHRPRQKSAAVMFFARCSEGAAEQSSVTLLAGAMAPDDPSSPKLALNGALGVFFGAVLGIGAALLRELGDRRVRSSKELEFLLPDVPVLGRIAAVPIPCRLSAEVGQLELEAGG